MYKLNNSPEYSTPAMDKLINPIEVNNVMKKSWASKKKLIDYYNKLSSNYDQLYGEEQELKYFLILKTLKLQSRYRVLDFGCGTGLLLKTLEESKASFLVGVDISSGMLTKAKERGLHKVDLILCDGEFLPIRDGAFNIVFMITVFQNLYNKKLGLEHVIRTTREGGIIFLSVPNKSDYPSELLRYITNEEELTLIDRIHGSKDLIVVLRKLKVHEPHNLLE